MEVGIDPKTSCFVNNVLYHQTTMLLSQASCSQTCIYSILLLIGYTLSVLVVLSSVDCPCDQCITKTCPCNIQRFFSAVKIENFIRKMWIFFLFLLQNIDCGYSLEPPRRGGSNMYPQSMFWSKNKKNRYTPAYPIFTL